MEIIIIGKIIVSLVFIFGLLYLALRLLRKYSKIGSKIRHSQDGLHIAALLYVDENAKVVNLRRANINYVLVIGKNNMLLIDKYTDNEQRIKPKYSDLDNAPK